MALTNNDIGKAILIAPQSGWGKYMVGILVEIGPTHHVCKNVAVIYRWGKNYDTTKEEDESMYRGWNKNIELRKYPKELEIEIAHLNNTISLWDDQGKLNE